MRKPLARHCISTLSWVTRTARWSLNFLDSLHGFHILAVSVLNRLSFYSSILLARLLSCAWHRATLAVHFCCRAISIALLSWVSLLLEKWRVLRQIQARSRAHECRGAKEVPSCSWWSYSALVETSRAVEVGDAGASRAPSSPGACCPLQWLGVGWRYARPGAFWMGSMC